MDDNLTPAEAEATIPVQDACYLYCVAPALTFPDWICAAWITPVSIR